jgi:hypothetical protein
MEIRKKNNYFELAFEGANFVIDPPNLNFQPPIILTDFQKNINKDKIFNSPGEYNVSDIYFWGFDNNGLISYLFKNKEGGLLFSLTNLSEETLKKIKLMTKEISALFLLNSFDDKLVATFKPNLILTNKNINLPKFEKQRGDKLKINLKKVNNLIFIFEK